MYKFKLSKIPVYQLQLRVMSQLKFPFSYMGLQSPLFKISKITYTLWCQVQTEQKVHAFIFLSIKSLEGSLISTSLF